MRLAPRKKQPA